MVWFLQFHGFYDYVLTRPKEGDYIDLNTAVNLLNVENEAAEDKYSFYNCEEIFEKVWPYKTTENKKEWLNNFKPKVENLGLNKSPQEIDEDLEYIMSRFDEIKKDNLDRFMGNKDDSEPTLLSTIVKELK